jgi:glycosyltransferase involved in cell wall biosynthesis
MTDSETRRILAVCGGGFNDPSEKQVLWFERELAERGHSVLISVAGDPDGAVEAGGRPAVATRRHRLRGTRLAAADIEAAREFSPTLIHAWNPRANVAAAARAYERATGAPVFMHWEDDEWTLARTWRTGSPLRRSVRTARRLTAGVRPAGWPFATGASLKWAASLEGHDALTPALAARAGERTGRTAAVVLPANPPDSGPVEDAPLPAGEAGRELVVYTGMIHPEHRLDVLLGMRAVATLRARGRDAVFVHAGGVLLGSETAPELAAEAGLGEDAAVFLGYISSLAQVRGLLRAATVLVQPGRATDFNRFRLPSKLQTYLASGTPTVTFAVGFGELLRDGEEALLTHSDDPAELADLLESAIADPAVRDRLARGGPAAAKRLFDPAANCEALLAHYEAVLDQQPSALGRPESLLNRQ